MKRYRAVDLFCGAGGTTEGARQSAHVDVKLAINHWRPAISSHSANHPDVRHICASIDHVDPRDFCDMKLDVLAASPECVFHSNARGGQPVDDQRRATAWCVPRWDEALRPKWIVVENVREFEDWAPLGVDNKPLKSKKGEIFQAWIQTLRALNYHVEWRLINAADHGGATKRTRLFVMARRGRSAQPMPWPAISHAKGNWTPAAAIIDWSKPCPSIFDRKRPLAEKTLRRIEIGLRKFCGPGVESFIVKLRRNSSAGSVHDPLDTLTAGALHHALAMPFQFKAMGRNPGATKSIGDPLPTIVATRENHAIVVPFFVNYHGGPDGDNRHSGPEEPLPVIDTNPRHALVQPYLIDVNHGDGDRSPGGRVHSIDDPFGTVTTKRSQALIQPFLMDIHNRRRDDTSTGIEEPMPTIVTKPGNSLVLPFLTQFNGTGGADSIHDPLTTVTTKHRHGLVMVKLLETMAELGICDIGFRMLDVDELAAAQGFPPGYQLFGSKAEQIKQIGNSVHTAVAKALFESIGSAA